MIPQVTKSVFTEILSEASRDVYSRITLKMVNKIPAAESSCLMVKYMLEIDRAIVSLPARV